jgi:hypothetical protein
MTKEEAEKELLESFAETIAPILFDPLMRRDWETAAKCVEIAQEYSDQQNSSLIKEVEESKAVYSLCSKVRDEIAKDYLLAKSQISQLKEALEQILKKLPDEDNLDYDPGDIINCIYEIASSATQALKEKE